MNRMVFLSCIITVLCFQPAVMSQDTVNTAGMECLKVFLSESEKIRSAWLLMSTVDEQSAKNSKIPSAENLAKAMNILGKLKRDGLPEWGKISGYLMERIKFQSGDYSTSFKNMSDMMTAIMAPEVLYRLYTHDDKHNNVVNQCKSLLLPLENVLHGSVLPYGVARKRLILEVRIPNTNGYSLIEVAAQLEKAGLYEMAWHAYAEAGYTTYSPVGMQGKIDGTWLCPDAAILWFKAGECARKAGKTDFAWDYLMKASVFGNDNLYKKTLEIAGQWSGTDIKTATDRNSGNLDMEDIAAVKIRALVVAVNLYTAMNLHPRAIQLINEKGGEFGPHYTTLLKESEAGWIRTMEEFVNDHVINVKDGQDDGKQKLVMFGQVVFPNGDPLKVKIPQALSDEAIAEVKKKLQELQKQPASRPYESKPSASQPAATTP